ncbi:MAG: hypothetical protein EOO89_00375 [Pedobacter sp.]|nr:MAG: hypothetical protein EOO89_00375 [Pedobacter sp.]
MLDFPLLEVNCKYHDTDTVSKFFSEYEIAFYFESSKNEPYIEPTPENSKTSEKAHWLISDKNLFQVDENIQADAKYKGITIETRLIFSEEQLPEIPLPYPLLVISTEMGFKDVLLDVVKHEWFYNITCTEEKHDSDEGFAEFSIYYQAECFMDLDGELESIAEVAVDTGIPLKIEMVQSSEPNDRKILPNKWFK